METIQRCSYIDVRSHGKTGVVIEDVSSLSYLCIDDSTLAEEILDDFGLSKARREMKRSPTCVGVWGTYTNNRHLQSVFRWTECENNEPECGVFVFTR